MSRATCNHLLYFVTPWPALQPTPPTPPPPPPPPPPRLSLRKHPDVPSGEERVKTDAFAGYTRLKHLYSPSEEGLESLRPRQVTPTLGLIQVTAEVISGVGKGLWASDR